MATDNNAVMFAFYNGPRRNLRADDVAGIQAIYGARYFTIPGFRPWANYGIGVGRWLVGDFNGDGMLDVWHGVANTDYIHIWRSVRT